MTLLTRWMFRSAAVLMLLCSASACTKDRWSESHDSGSRLSAARPECPQVWDTIPLLDTARGTPVPYVVPARGLAVPGPNTNIPEFHDCQKFIDSRGSGFDSLYAIFASNRLDSIGDSMLRLDGAVWSSSDPNVASVSASGVVTAVSAGAANISAILPGPPSPVTTVGVVVTQQMIPVQTTEILVGVTPAPPTQLHVGQSVSLTLAIGAPTTSMIASAQVYTYGQGYPPLGIAAGFNCLYLYYDTTRALVARMVPAAAGSGEAPACRDALNPNEASGTELTVVRSKPSAVAADYPPVARWDYDSLNQQYHIGIKCGHGWCDVGASGRTNFTPSRTIDYNAAAPSDENRVLRVKGWHDQQNLAMIALAGGATVPSGILGTVVPHPKLGTYGLLDFAAGNWVLTGYVGMDTTNAIAGAVRSYKEKFNFDPVPVALPLKSMNTLSFCYGKRSECRIPVPPANQGCKDIGIFGREISVWWVKIVAATDKKVMYRCVTRRGHTEMPDADQIAPTARWRWIADDETVWEYCMSHHCCEVGANGFSAGWFAAPDA